MLNTKHFAVAVIVILCVVGCSSILNRSEGVLGKEGKKEDLAKARIDLVDRNVARVNEQRLNQIGELSYGTDYALGKSTNKEHSTTIAKELNDRVQALADKPSFEAIQEIKCIVDELITNNAAGIKQLENKDREIAHLQSTVEKLKVDKQSAVDNYINIADKAAAEADSYKQTLKQMDSFFGLGAVFYGVKRLIVSAIWFISVGGVVFLILRFAAASNPLAGTVFAVFEHAASYVIHVIVGIFPKVMEFAGYIKKT